VAIAVCTLVRACEKGGGESRESRGARRTHNTVELPRRGDSIYHRRLIRRLRRPRYVISQISRRGGKQKVCRIGGKKSSLGLSRRARRGGGGTNRRRRSSVQPARPIDRSSLAACRIKSPRATVFRKSELSGDYSRGLFERTQRRDRSVAIRSVNLHRSRDVVATAINYEMIASRTLRGGAKSQ